jgi:NAD(P)-dependent dehydrogenase (short-subunit alcohol dehydrogenase family)
MTFNLEGKTALLVGSSGNLGPVWLEALESSGVTVLAPDLTELDVEVPGSIENYVRVCRTKKEIPEIIIYNAGIDNPPNSTSDMWGSRRIMDVNYFGAQDVCEAFWELFKRWGGHIIFIGSIFGSVSPDHRNYPAGFDKPAMYGASKAALGELTRHLATRGAPFGIRVNMLSLAAFDSGQEETFKRKYLRSVPMQRMAQADDYKWALIGLLMQTYMTGHEMMVDGGYTAW